jgi:hypothetical protein
MFSEGFVFLGRGTALYSIYPSWMYFILHIFYILFFALWSFPFLLGFAAIYFESKNDLPLLKPLRTRAGLVIIAAGFVICVIILSSLPSYSDQWRQRIIIDQSVNLNTGVCKTTLKSSEYLRNLNVHLANKDTALSGWDREIFLDEFKIDSEPWIHIERAMTTSSDSGTTFDFLTKVRFKYRPEKFSLSYSSAKKKIADVYSIFAHSQTESSVSLDWESFPDTSLVIPIHFKVINSDSVTETIDARFIEMVEPIRIEKEFINIVPRSNIKRTELLRPADRK